MKRGALSRLVLVWLLASSLPAWAQEPLQQHWAQAKAHLERGAYRDALQELDIILTLNPDDPWASAYRTICEKRLRERERFVQLTPGQLASLQDALQREQTNQRRAAAQAEAIHRQLKKEQARWDAELKRIQEEALRERNARAREEKLKAAERRRALQQQRRELARQAKLARAGAQPTSQPVAPTPPEPTGPPAGAKPLREPSRPQTIELKPVTVPTAAPEKPPRVTVEPTLPPPAPPPPTAPIEPTPTKAPAPPAPLVRPPGTVQIFADQLNVSPDRQIAVAEGNVRIEFEDGSLTANRVTVFTDTKDAYAQGRVRLERGNEVFRGEMVHYNINTKKGRFLEGTAFAEPWYQHGRVIEHIAEGVLRVKPGYLTSCEFEPPHFRLQGREATVFTTDKIARGRNVTLTVEELPLIYFPWLSVADRQTPFFLIPGKNKIWEQFALMGYRYEWPQGQRGVLRWDWRRTMGWGFGLDHRLETDRLGRALLKLYYNEERNIRRPESDLPKGADINRYRALWRHYWQPRPDTTMVTNIQEFSDIDFRRELLFREEFVRDDNPETFVSWVTGTPYFSSDVLLRKRMNRFETVTEAFPEATFLINAQQIKDSPVFVESKLNVANLQERTAHSETDRDVVRVDWFQQLGYALNLFRPILVTPKMGVRQTYYTKDIQSGTTDRPQGKRDVISGQFSGGVDASLKLFRIFPVTTNALGLNINWLRHVVTPTVAYTYMHKPTVPSDILNFATAGGPTNQVTFGLENKLQTKRVPGQGLFALPSAQQGSGRAGSSAPAPASALGGPGKQAVKPQSVDLVRFFVSIPYTFHGHGNEQGGRLGDWGLDLEMFPWPWMRLETNWSYPSHFLKGSRDERVTGWNLDLVMVGGRGEPEAPGAPDIRGAPARKGFQPGPQMTSGFALLPQGQWYFGLGHRFSHNDKTEDVIQFDWRISEKWQIGAFHRITWKEVAGGDVKRFNHLRETQYTLTRDLHDWMAELVYRVDREYGEELFFTMTLKAYPELPIEMETSYHQPKIGSQSSPFSPVPRQ